MFTSEQGLAILLVLAMLGAVLWLLGARGRLALRFARRRSAVVDRLQLVSSLPIGQQQAAHLLEVDGREYLVVASANAVQIVNVHTHFSNMVHDQIRGQGDLSR